MFDTTLVETNINEKVKYMYLVKDRVINSNYVITIKKWDHTNIGGNAKSSDWGLVFIMRDEDDIFVHEIKLEDIKVLNLSTGTCSNLVAT